MIEAGVTDASENDLRILDKRRDRRIGNQTRLESFQARHI
jgi:hypothetical protein